MSQTRIVIADDESIIRMDLKEMLAGLGYLVVGEAGDGVSAVNLARELRPDLVIMDVKMPDMDGMAFYTQFQATALEHQPRVVIMTGDTSNTQTSEFLQRSKLPVLSKPFTRQELLAVLADAQE